MDAGDGPESAARGSVLIVDDDLGYAHSLAVLLQQNGYRGRCAATPEQALAALREPPGESATPVAVIDLRLGAAGGLDLTARLHAERPELVCVLMADQFDAPTAIAALRRGVYDCFDKSGDPTSLLPVIERCFDCVARQREREAAVEALHLAKQAAEAASRGKSGFLATISHELRTPLNAIIGFSEMMLRGVFGPLYNDHYRAYVADIHDSGTHLLRIINDILDLSKAEAGKLELQEEVFDLRRTVHSVRQLLADRLRNGGLSDAIELPDDLPLLRADEGKTKQVLLNLVANAVKFTPPGGHVAIAGRFNEETGLTLTVSDTGIGIAPHDLRRVLEPFEQVDTRLTRSHPGTGLGLPLVKAIMELHGGSLELHSNLGTGTRVTVAFPPQRAVVGPAGRRTRSAA